MATKFTALVSWVEEDDSTFAAHKEAFDWLKEQLEDRDMPSLEVSQFDVQRGDMTWVPANE